MYRKIWESLYPVSVVPVEKGSRRKIQKPVYEQTGLTVVMKSLLQFVDGD